MKIFIFTITCFGVVLTAPKPQYHAPVVHAAPVYHAPIVHAAPVYQEVPSPYSYQYRVHDDYSGANYNAGETADGNGNVEGSYTVALPDGRTQSVNYHADDYSGYVADVTYDGVPQYAAVHAAPAYHAPVVQALPVIHAAPAYHAPVYHG